MDTDFVLNAWVYVVFFVSLYTELSAEFSYFEVNDDSFASRNDQVYSVFVQVESFLFSGDFASHLSLKGSSFNPNKDDSVRNTSETIVGRK